MASRLSFTFDLEDHRSGRDRASRYIGITYQVLEFLERLSCSGTFFIVATVAERFPALTRAIAGAGHEVAFHGYDHTPLDEDEPARFRRDTERGKRLLEDLIGREVHGYRAPIFSLMKTTTWSVDTLASLGFTYSASVLPAGNRRWGFPGAPQQPFRWASGLVELPVATTSIAGVDVPFLGGGYFRYLPISLVLRRLGAASVGGLWTYLHPYDCDAGEGLHRVERATALESLILACNRRGTLQKMETLLAGRVDVPLGRRVLSGEFSMVPRLHSV